MDIVFISCQAIKLTVSEVTIPLICAIVLHLNGRGLSMQTCTPIYPIRIVYVTMLLEYTRTATMCPIHTGTIVIHIRIYAELKLVSLMQSMYIQGVLVTVAQFNGESFFIKKSRNRAIKYFHIKTP